MLKPTIISLGLRAMSSHVQYRTTSPTIASKALVNEARKKKYNVLLLFIAMSLAQVAPRTNTTPFCYKNKYVPPLFNVTRSFG